MSLECSALLLVLPGQSNLDQALFNRVFSRLDKRYQVVNSLEQLVRESEQHAINLVIVDYELYQSSSGNKIIMELGEKSTPVLVMLNHDDDADQARDSGAFCDFFRTSLGPELLTAKIKSMLLWREHLLDHRQKQAAMLMFQQQAEQEQTIASNLFNNVLKNRFLETSAVATLMSEHALCHGDFVLVGRTPNDHLHILLGDFSGQGIAAAFVAAPVADIFYGMSAKGFSIKDIADEINRKLCALLTVDMFLAASLVVLQPENKSLQCLNCGMPPMILRNQLNTDVIVVGSENLPLGIQAEVDWQTQTMEVSPDHRLYLINDAVIDIEDSQQEKLGLERWRQSIQRLDGHSIDRLRELLTRYSGSSHVLDEIALIELTCLVDSVPWKSVIEDEVKSKVEALSWKTMMEFDVNALRHLNPVPVMMNALMEIQDLQDHQQSIFLIVTELFANALDHGLLGLDSAIKHNPEGFMRFYELKEQALASLTSGKIRVLFQHTPTDSGGRLQIRVTDSGDGFDYRRGHTGLSENEGFSGRGINLMRSICSELYYQGKGNRVTAVYDWEHG